MLHLNNWQNFTQKNTKQKPPTMKAPQVKKVNTNTHHFWINCGNRGATSCGQTKPRRPIVIAKNTTINRERNKFMQSEHTIVHKHEHSHCLTNFINMSVTVNIIGNYFKHTMYMSLHNAMPVRKRQKDHSCTVTWNM